MRLPTITTFEWCYCAICGGPFEPAYFINKKSEVGYGYDPKVISKEEATWITEVRLLLEAISQEKKGYISGKGKYHYQGYIELSGMDRANWYIPSNFKYTCYKIGHNPRPLGAIPFHWPCFELLAHSIYPGVDNPVQHVDLFRLYGAMYYLTEDGYSLGIHTGAEKRRKGH
ncbi:hypothetical protein F4811DRAFT_534351 [Daldinia bambusicola]|nr:hypothetical protein F4811DRAFT_534351 [Daldinia bambusicola]